MCYNEVYSAVLCPVEFGIFGETTTHVILKTRQLHLTEL